MESCIIIFAFASWSSLVRFLPTHRQRTTVRGTVKLIIFTYVLLGLMYAIPEIVVPLTESQARVNSYALACRAEAYMRPDIAVPINQAGIDVPLVLIAVFCALSMVLLVRRHTKKTTVSMAASASTTAARAKATNRGLAVMAGTVFAAYASNAPMILSNWITISILPGITFRCMLYVSYLNPAIDPFVYTFLMPKLRAAIFDVLGCGGGNKVGAIGSTTTAGTRKTVGSAVSASAQAAAAGPSQASSSSTAAADSGANNGERVLEGVAQFEAAPGKAD